MRQPTFFMAFDYDYTGNIALLDLPKVAFFASREVSPEQRRSALRWAEQTIRHMSNRPWPRGASLSSPRATSLVRVSVPRRRATASSPRWPRGASSSSTPRQAATAPSPSYTTWNACRDGQHCCNRPAAFIKKHIGNGRHIVKNNNSHELAALSGKFSRVRLRIFGNMARMLIK